MWIQQCENEYQKGLCDGVTFGLENQDMKLQIKQGANLSRLSRCETTRKSAEGSWQGRGVIDWIDRFFLRFWIEEFIRYSDENSIGVKTFKISVSRQTWTKMHTKSVHHAQDIFWMLGTQKRICALPRENHV